MADSAKVRSFSLYITTYGETHHAGHWYVETEADLEVLHGLGVKLGQGEIF